MHNTGKIIAMAAIAALASCGNEPSAEGLADTQLSAGQDIDTPGASTTDSNWLSADECFAAIQSSTSPIKKIFGVYLTNDANVVMGNWRLSSLAFSGVFADGTDDGQKQITMDFEDITSALVANELGEAHENQERITVTQCKFEEPAIMLKGTGDKLGVVELSGDFNIEQLAESNLDETSKEYDSFIGMLKIGTQEKPIVLGLFLGD